MATTRCGAVIDRVRVRVRGRVRLRSSRQLALGDSVVKNCFIPKSRISKFGENSRKWSPVFLGLLFGQLEVRSLKSRSTVHSLALPVQAASTLNPPPVVTLLLDAKPKPPKKMLDEMHTKSLSTKKRKEKQVALQSGRRFVNRPLQIFSAHFAAFGARFWASLSFRPHFRFKVFGLI